MKVDVIITRNNMPSEIFQHTECKSLSRKWSGTKCAVKFTLSRHEQSLIMFHHDTRLDSWRQITLPMLTNTHLCTTQST